MSDPPSTTSDLIRQTTETVGNFIRWIAELIVSKNWFTLLVLAAIVVAFCFNPGGGIALKALGWLEDGTALPSWYRILFWIAEAALILAALTIAVRARPREAKVTAEAIAERKTIKGLRPFSREDASVFAQLQRKQSLRDCLETLTSASFRFGILMGESGCGKTSFLQAGLWPQLSGKDTPYRGVYIRFSEQEPLRTIARALAEQLEIPLEWIRPEGYAQAPCQVTDDFLKLLSQASDASDQPLILFFDQFEQFFVHAPRQAQRQPFVAALAAWYRQPEQQPTRILISIRSDLLYHLDELQKALGYSLGPKDVVHLQKFSPEAACNIFSVIARSEGIPFDRRFVTELAEQELASREDGLISPVNLQILAWTIERQGSQELRAFNRNAFQKFGGVEGLLSRFLQQTLDTRVVASQRQTAVKVLLALTDLDRQVRAGVLTVVEIQAKLQNTVPLPQIQETVDWLARGDVRLITPHERDSQQPIAKPAATPVIPAQAGIQTSNLGLNRNTFSPKSTRDPEMGYELAHERIIPALLRQAGKELSDADRANQLLDRRVNEWLGNQRQSRYWFGPRELWLLERQRPYLVWGAKRPQKEHLLRLSRWRTYGIGSALVLVALVTTSFYSWLWFTPWGQIQQVEWQLTNHRLLDNASADKVREVAVAFAKYQKPDKALNAVNRYIEDNWRKFYALEQIAHAYGKLKDEANTSAFLNDALAVAKNLDDDNWRKAHALQAITQATDELQDEANIIGLLDKVAAAAKVLNVDPLLQIYMLEDIANTYRKSQHEASATAILNEALTIAKKIDQDWRKVDALQSIAPALKNNEVVKTKALLNDALTTAETIDRDWRKVQALQSIARTLKNNDVAKAKALLNDALKIAETIDRDWRKVQALQSIAQGYEYLQDEAKVVEILSKALIVTPSIENDTYKASALQKIIEITGNLKDQSSKAPDLLNKTLTITKTINDDNEKSITLKAISEAVEHVRDSTKASTLLEDVLDATKTFYDLNSGGTAFQGIAQAARKLQDESKASEILDNVITTASDIFFLVEIDILQAVSRSVWNLKDEAKATLLLNKALSNARSIEDEKRAFALQSIAQAYGKFDEAQAAEILNDALNNARTIDGEEERNDILRGIAWTYHDLTNFLLKEDGLHRTLRLAKQSNASPAMGAIAVLYAKQGDWGRSLSALRGCVDSDRIEALAQVLTVRAEAMNPQLIEGAVVLEVEADDPQSPKILTATIDSPDKGCDQYADWWEVLEPDGTLIQRQVIAKPHPDEQPFTSQMKLKKDLDPEQTVMIRAHFSDGIYLQTYQQSFNYTDQALQGSVARGFGLVRPSQRFAAWLEDEEPQPPECVD